jgi:hypothetical protein
MAYIKSGDLLVSKAYGTKYIATSDSFIKRVPGTGEFLDDYSFVPAVDTLNPETGARGWMFLRDVTKVND